MHVPSSADASPKSKVIHHSHFTSRETIPFRFNQPSDISRYPALHGQQPIVQTLEVTRDLGKHVRLEEPQVFSPSEAFAQEGRYSHNRKDDLRIYHESRIEEAEDDYYYEDSSSQQLTHIIKMGEGD
jgi:hypothetical protein